MTMNSVSEKITAGVIFDDVLDEAGGNAYTAVNICIQMLLRSFEHADITPSEKERILADMKFHVSKEVLDEITRAKST